MVKIRKCLPKVNFERFLLLTALQDFLAELPYYGGAHERFMFFMVPNGIMVSNGLKFTRL